MPLRHVLILEKGDEITGRDGKILPPPDRAAGSAKVLIEIVRKLDVFR